MKQASCSSALQGGGKRRWGMILRFSRSARGHVQRASANHRIAEARISYLLAELEWPDRGMPSLAFDIHRQRAMWSACILLYATFRMPGIRRYTDRAVRQIVAFFGPVS